MRANFGSWQHIAITYDFRIPEKKLYVDGNLVATTNDRITPNLGVNPFNIGAGGDFGTEFYFDGEIDDIGLWDGPLGLQEIRTARTNGVAASPVSWRGANETINNLIPGVDAFTSIQAAIDAVEDGGTVHIAQGSYVLGAELRIDKNVTIVGAGAHVTEISGNDRHRVFNIDGDDVALSRLSIVDGRIGGGGGIYHRRGNLSLSDCVLARNWASFGGGIASVGGELTITNSTFSDNFALCEGGGLYTSSRATIVNSTFSGNRTNDGFGGGVGGGIYANQHLLGVTAINCTITLNSANLGGGLATDGSSGNSGNIRVSNSIIAGNFAPQDPDVRSFITGGETHTVTSGGGNFVGIDTTPGIKAFADDLRFNNTSASTIDDVIRTNLTFNGGNTPTHRLLLGSPAIDAGIDAAAVDHNGNPLLTDQRGASFSRSICLTTDSGAIEANLSVCPTVAQDRLDEGTTYDTGTGIELDTASIKFAGAVDDGGIPFPEGDPSSNFDPENVEASIELYMDMVLSHTPFWVLGFDAGGVTVTSRGPGLVEQLLVNGSFEDPDQININTNNLGVIPTGWSQTGPAETWNIIRNDGTPYSNGVDIAADGSQVLDLNGEFELFQSFNLTSPSDVTFGASFANREIHDGSAPSTVGIFDRSGTNLLSSLVSVNTSSDPTPSVAWRSGKALVTNLPAGKYQLRIHLNNFNNVDAAFATATPADSTATAADFDRFPNPFGGSEVGLTNFTEVERAIANPGVSFSITNHDAVNFGDPDTDTAGGGRILPDEPFPNDTDGDDNNFLVTFEANLVVPATGTYHIGFQGDDGGYVRIPGQTFSNLIENVTGRSVIDEGGARILCDCLTGNSSTVGIISLAEGVYPVQGGFFEREGGAHFEVFALEPGTNVSALIRRNGAGSRVANAWDLAANQTKLLRAIRELMVPYIYAAKNAQAYGAKARLILPDNLPDLEAKEQEMDDNARSHLVRALEAFENFARDPQLDYLLRDPVPTGFLEGDNSPLNAFKEARRQLFSAYGRALATLARVDLNQFQREYHSQYNVEVYRGSPTASPVPLDTAANAADAAASLLQMRLLILGAISGLEEFPQGDFVIASSGVPRLRQLASAIRRGETVFIHDADRPSATAGHGYGSYFVPFFYEAGDTGSVFSSFGGLLSKAMNLAGLSREADAAALASIGDYAFNREAVETRLENLMRETNAQLADLCGTIEVIQDGALILVPDLAGIHYRYPESGENEQGWSPGQIYQQRLAIHAAQNRFLSAATYLANVRERANDVLDTFLQKKSLNQNFVENILTKNNEQLIGLSKQAGELEADLIEFRAKVQADLKRNQGGGTFGRFATGALGLGAAIATGNPVAAVGAVANLVVGETDIANEIGATQSVAAEESSVRRQITGLEAQKLDISFETELAGIALQLEEEELLVFQQHREILREASRAEIDLESARIDILAQESALGSLTGRVNFILSELIAELSSLEDSVQNSPDTRIIRDAAIERADMKLIEAREWAFLAARSGQYLSFGNNNQFGFFLDMERRVLAERNSQDLEDYLDPIRKAIDLPEKSQTAQEKSLEKVDPKT